MMADGERKNNPSDIHLQIESLRAFQNDQFSGLVVEWSSDIGFGQYTLYNPKDSSVWYADSECMDSDEDRAFIKELFKLIADGLKMEGQSLGERYRTIQKIFDMLDLFYANKHLHDKIERKKSMEKKQAELYNGGTAYEQMGAN